MTRRTLALGPLLLLCAFHGGGVHGGGCAGCAHTGSSLGHAAGGSHLSSGGFHASAPVHVAAHVPSHAAGDVAAHVAAAVIDATAEALAAAATEPPPPTTDGLCRAFTDCGAGSRGHGAVCDRSAADFDPEAEGVCRDACLDNQDCTDDMRCLLGRDPTDPIWGACVP